MVYTYWPIDYWPAGYWPLVYFYWPAGEIQPPIPMSGRRIQRFIVYIEQHPSYNLER